MLGTLTPDEFLKRHWQRQPLLVRAAVAGDACPLSPDELSGLACEDLVESRLVVGSPSGPFRVEHGPFDEERFATLPERDWTLLVQDVDKHVEGFERLLERVSFVPEWRIDDVMVSYAAEGGSVGPHSDAYDVFLVQARGRRRWQWAEDHDPELRGDCAIGVLERFQAEHEAVLSPGDVLYLPPGVAHFGVALEPCMTLSVGFRAPDQRRLALAFVEEMVDAASDERRFVDPGRPPEASSLRLSGADRQQLRSLLRELLSPGDEQLDDFLGRYLTRPKPNLDPMLEGQRASELPDVERRLAAGDRLARRLGSRWLTYEAGGELLLFADGRRFTACPPDEAWLGALGSGRREDGSGLTGHPGRLTLLGQLLDAGALDWEPRA